MLYIISPWVLLWIKPSRNYGYEQFRRVIIVFGSVVLMCICWYSKGEIYNIEHSVYHKQGVNIDLSSFRNQCMRAKLCCCFHAFSILFLLDTNKPGSMHACALFYGMYWVWLCFVFTLYITSSTFGLTSKLSQEMFTFCTKLFIWLQYVTSVTTQLLTLSYSLTFNSEEYSIQLSRWNVMCVQLNSFVPCSPSGSIYMVSSIK